MASAETQTWGWGGVGGSHHRRRQARQRQRPSLGCIDSDRTRPIALTLGFWAEARTVCALQAAAEQTVRAAMLGWAAMRAASSADCRGSANAG